MRQKLINVIFLSIIPVLLIWRDWHNPTSFFLGSCAYISGLGFGYRWGKRERRRDIIENFGIHHDANPLSKNQGVIRF